MSPFVTSLLLTVIVSVGPSAEAMAQESPSASTAAPSTDAGEIGRHVKTGQKVFVVDDRGRELKGRVGELSADSLVLIVDRDRTDLPYERIVRIDRRRDGVLNGVLIGFGVGAGLGLVGALASTGDSGWGSPDPAEVALIAPPILGGIGAGIGLAVDALIGREKNLYRRPGATRISLSPALGRRSGISVSVSW